MNAIRGSVRTPMLFYNILQVYVDFLKRWIVHVFDAVEFQLRIVSRVMIASENVGGNFVVVNVDELAYR